MTNMHTYRRVTFFCLYMCSLTVVLCKDVSSMRIQDNTNSDLFKKLLDRVDQLELEMSLQKNINTKQQEVNEKLTLQLQEQIDTNKQQYEIIQKQATELDRILAYIANENKSTDQEFEQPVSKITRVDILTTAESDDEKHNDAKALSKQGFVNPLQRGTRQSEYVAFTAYVDHVVQHLGIDQPIVYDKVLLNEGSAYNTKTGMLSVPTDGLYVFNFLVSTNNIHQIVAKLVVDGTNQLDGISDTYHQYQEAQGGNFMILSLHKGQTVYVEAYRWTDVSIDSSDQSRFASFSGFRLY